MTARPAALTLLLDTNIILDVLLRRTPWANDAVLLLDAVAKRHATGFVAGHTITTIHYIVQRKTDATIATTAVADLLGIVDVVPVDAADFHRALSLRLPDFEDSVQAAAALKIGADFLVSRDERDYRGAPISIRSASDVLALLPP